MDYRLQLFKHPRAFENGDTPNEDREIGAATLAIAKMLAEGDIAAAPASALSHVEDRFVLLDDEGEKVWEWDSTSTPEASEASSPPASRA